MIKINHYQKAAPEYHSENTPEVKLYEKKERLAGKMYETRKSALKHKKAFPAGYTNLKTNDKFENWPKDKRNAKNVTTKNGAFTYR